MPRSAARRAGACAVLAVVAFLALASVPARAADDVDGSSVAADDARAAADDILARPEFQPRQKTPVDRAMEWIGEQIGKLFGATIGGGSGVMGWVILALIVAAIVWLARRVTVDVVRVADDDAAATVDVEERRPTNEWMREAERFERAGRWREALRCRYRVLVGTLIDRGVVPDVPGRTAGEFRADVAVARPEVSPPFAEATELFELAWYGHVETSPDEHRRFQDLASSVTAGVRG